MTDWQGVHNRAEHVSVGTRASCTTCGQWCYAHAPCWCCEEVTLGDCTAAELWERVHVAEAARSWSLRSLVSARRQLAVLTALIGAWCFVSVFIADGWVQVALFAVCAVALAYASGLHWEALRRARAQVTALEGHE